MHRHPLLPRPARTLAPVLLLALSVGLLSGPAAAAEGSGPAASAQPLERAHAHNDYEHDRPLLDALDNGFTSLEADVWLVGDQLLVAHDAEDLDPARTLQALYLDPLAAQVAADGGEAFTGSTEGLQLLVDIKTEGPATYERLHEVLEGYQQMLTTYTATPHGYDAAPGAVTAVVSGNRPTDLMARQEVRFAAYDGRLSDLTNGIDPDFMPLVSDNWTMRFDWVGEGSMPAEQRERLEGIVDRAHDDGRRVRFWATPDVAGPAREAVWRELVAAGVDHINTDDLAGLRDFLLAVDPREAVVPAEPSGAPFDLQAHRGGLGLVVESTLAGFGNALEVGVSTLELDVQITEDGQAVVTHDRQVNGAKCRDTAPVQPGDPEFPYVGKYVTTLTLAQVRSLDCGSQTLPAFPQQRPDPGARMPLLAEVFALVEAYGADDVRFNVETKVEAAAPSETASREQFVQVVAHEVRQAGLLDRVSVQSFDWGALMRMAQVEPRLELVALTNGDFLEVGQQGASPWLGGIDVDDFGGSLVAAVDSFGADAISPVHGMPQDGAVTDPGYQPFTTPELVAEAHAAGLAVIPWTVDDRATMEALVDAGVDGIITDYPDRLRSVMAERGLRLPAAYPAP